MNSLLKRLFNETSLALIVSPLARILVALIFVVAGVGKLGAGYAETAGYMASMGVPTILLPFTIALEIGGGLLLMLGWQTRVVAVALAGFSVVSALIFHTGADPMQQIMLLKNMSMAGGLLLLAIHGAGRVALDK